MDDKYFIIADYIFLTNLNAVISIVYTLKVNLHINGLLVTKIINIVIILNLNYVKLKIYFNRLSPGGTYMVHKNPIFLSTPELKGLVCGLIYQYLMV